MFKYILTPLVHPLPWPALFPCSITNLQYTRFPLSFSPGFYLHICPCFSCGFIYNCWAWKMGGAKWSAKEENLRCWQIGPSHFSVFQALKQAKRASDDITQQAKMWGLGRRPSRGTCGLQGDRVQKLQILLMSYMEGPKEGTVNFEWRRVRDCSESRKGRKGGHQKWMRVPAGSFPPSL